MTGEFSGVEMEGVCASWTECRTKSQL